MLRFYTAFPEDLQQNKPEYVVASDRLLYALAHKTDAEGLVWATVHQQVADLVSFGQLIASVNHLVKRNLITYSNPERICFHSRALKWAYQQLWPRDTWRTTVDAAVEECKNKQLKG